MTNRFILVRFERFVLAQDLVVSRVQTHCGDAVVLRKFRIPVFHMRLDSFIVRVHKIAVVLRDPTVDQETTLMLAATAAAATATVFGVMIAAAIAAVLVVFAAATAFVVAMIMSAMPATATFVLAREGVNERVRNLQIKMDRVIEI